MKNELSSEERSQTKQCQLLHPHLVLAGNLPGFPLSTSDSPASSLSAGNLVSCVTDKTEANWSNFLTKLHTASSHWSFQSPLTSSLTAHSPPHSTLTHVSIQRKCVALHLCIPCPKLRDLSYLILSSFSLGCPSHPCFNVFMSFPLPTPLFLPPSLASPSIVKLYNRIFYTCSLCILTVFILDIVGGQSQVAEDDRKGWAGFPSHHGWDRLGQAALIAEQEEPQGLNHVLCRHLLAILNYSSLVSWRTFSGFCELF